MSILLRELDLNQRPLGYEPNELPDCSIPRYGHFVIHIRICPTNSNYKIMLLKHILLAKVWLIFIPPNVFAIFFLKKKIPRFTTGHIHNPLIFSYMNNSFANIVISILFQNPSGKESDRGNSPCRLHIPLHGQFLSLRIRGQ